MTPSTPFVTSEGFKPVSTEKGPSKLTKTLPKIRNAAMLLFGVLSARMATENLTSNPQADARAVAGWQADALVDLENTETTTLDFESLSADEKMELWDLCSKISSIPEDWYKTKEGENIPVTTEHLHAIVNILIDEFQQEKDSDRKRMIGWFIAILASGGFGTWLVRQYRSKDKKNKDAYFYSLFDEIKEYRKDGFEQNQNKTANTIEELIDTRIADLRMTYDVVPGVVYDPLDQPLQAFIAHKITELVGEKDSLTTRSVKILETKLNEVNAATNPDQVKKIPLKDEFDALIQKATSTLLLVNGAIDEQRRDLEKQQEIIDKRNKKERDIQLAREQAKEAALLLSESGLITPDNKKALVHFLDEMKDGKVTQQDIDNLATAHQDEMKVLTDRQSEVGTLLAFQGVPVFDVLRTDDFDDLTNTYTGISDLYARSVAVGYTDMNMDDISRQFAELDSFQASITELEQKLKGEVKEEEFEISFDESSLAGLASEVTEQEKLESDLKGAKEGYCSTKDQMVKDMIALQQSLNAFLENIQSETAVEIDDLSEKQRNQIDGLKTLYEMRDKWGTQKQAVLDGLMTHIEGGVADEHRKTQEQITNLEDTLANLNHEKAELQDKISVGNEQEENCTTRMSHVLNDLSIAEDDANIIHIQGLITEILNTPLEGENIPERATTIEHIVTQNSDGGYKNILSAGPYLKGKVQDKEFFGLLVRLNKLGKLMKIVEEKDAITTELQKNNTTLLVVERRLEETDRRFGEAKDLFEQLSEQLNTSEQQKIALETIKAALARVIDSLVSPTNSVTYATLEEIQDAFNDAVAQVIFEKDNPSLL